MCREHKYKRPQAFEYIYFCKIKYSVQSNKTSGTIVLVADPSMFYILRYVRAYIMVLKRQCIHRHQFEKMDEVYMHVALFLFVAAD